MTRLDTTVPGVPPTTWPFILSYRLNWLRGCHLPRFTHLVSCVSDRAGVLAEKKSILILFQIDEDKEAFDVKAQALELSLYKKLTAAI